MSCKHIRKLIPVLRVRIDGTQPPFSRTCPFRCPSSPFVIFSRFSVRDFGKSCFPPPPFSSVLRRSIFDFEIVLGFVLYAVLLAVLFFFSNSGSGDTLPVPNSISFQSPRKNARGCFKGE